MGKKKKTASQVGTQGEPLDLKIRTKLREARGRWGRGRKWKSGNFLLVIREPADALSKC